MKKTIYDYIAEHGYVNIHCISDSLNMREIDVLHTVNALVKSGFVGLSVHPINQYCECSCHYFTTRKKFLVNY